ncbi:72d9b908-c93e-4e46-aa45-cc103b0fe4b2 [Sclerotinia trifoliorum]|uniref:72d9b908-c93e-4e46-aa45-cc103b0fe4b2 n=1 Tax=Sclerotinia trifoliorum TaxID=28548 RepID=A0A8H2ZPK1_9HELO|nr:72d9b908-c93e-4e46-aa45-cc103b0fe4b2 [Sclerotinia trifoliorum]
MPGFFFIPKLFAIMKVTPSEDFDIVPGLEDEEIKLPDADITIATEIPSDEEEDYAEFSAAEPEPEPGTDNTLIFERSKLKTEIRRLCFITGVFERKLAALTATPKEAKATNDNTNDGDGIEGDFTDEIAEYSSHALETLREEYHSKLEKSFRKDKTSGRIPWIDTVPSLKRLNERLAEDVISMSARDLLDLRRWIDRVFDQGMTNCLPCGPTSASRFQWKKRYSENGLNDILRLVLGDHKSLEDLEKLRRHYDRIIGKGMVFSYLERRISVESKKRKNIDSYAEDSDAVEEME